MIKESFKVEEESKIEKLIESNASLEELFEDSGFLEEVTFQNSELFQYLAQEKTIRKLFDWMFYPKETEEYNFEKCSKYSFYAYSTIGNCSPELTGVIIKNPEYLKKLFCLINDDDKNTLTARGYFQAIIKNFLSELNPYLNQFIKVLKISPELYIFPLIKNLTRANMEIIKDILGTNEVKLKKLQLCVFEFLLFFYLNEQFESKSGVMEIFENIVEIFHFLNGQDNIIYKYKLKYEYTLYSEEFVNKKQFCEEIYFLKLALLHYIAVTKQITCCKKPEIFLKSYLKYKNSRKFFFYLKELLQFFKVLSKNKEFFRDLNSSFFFNLLEILQENPFKDIIHKLIFEIFENSKDFINKDKQTFKIFTEFLLQQEISLKFPSEKQKTNNPISLHYISILIHSLQIENITNHEIRDKLQMYRDLLSTLFTKLCFVEENNDFSEVEEHSDVELVLKKDFHLYNTKSSRRSVPNDKRFHYEDDIMKPELIENPESDRMDSVIFESKDNFNVSNQIIDSDYSDFEQLPEKNPDIVLNNFKDRSLLQNSERMKNELFSPDNSNFEETKVIGKSALFSEINLLFSTEEKEKEENEKN